MSWCLSQQAGDHCLQEIHYGAQLRWGLAIRTGPRAAPYMCLFQVLMGFLSSATGCFYCTTAGCLYPCTQAALSPISYVFHEGSARVPFVFCCLPSCHLGVLKDAHAQTALVLLLCICQDKAFWLKKRIEKNTLAYIFDQANQWVWLFSLPSPVCWPNNNWIVLYSSCSRTRSWREVWRGRGRRRRSK